MRNAALAAGDGDRRTQAAGRHTGAVGDVAHQRPDVDGLQPRVFGTGVQQQILDLGIEIIDPLHHRGDDVAVAPVGTALLQDLQ